MNGGDDDVQRREDVGHCLFLLILKTSTQLQKNENKIILAPLLVTLK